MVELSIAFIGQGWNIFKAFGSIQCIDQPAESFLPLAPDDEIESGLDDVGSFTYRSEQNRMTLVWVSNNTQTEPEDETDSVN